MSLALAHTGLVHAHGRVTGMFDQLAKEDPETVLGVGVSIFHAVATEPSHKEDGGNLACGAIGPGDEGSEALTVVVCRPPVKNLDVLEALMFWLGSRLSRRPGARYDNNHHHQNMSASSNHR